MNHSRHDPDFRRPDDVWSIQGPTSSRARKPDDSGEDEGILIRVGTTVALRRAMLYVLASALMFSLAGTVIKSLASDMSTPALVFWRNACSFLVLMIWFLVVGFPDVRTRRFGTHCWRALFTYGAFLTYFYAIREIHFANAVLLQSSAPIFVPVLALLIYRRLSDRFVWSGMVLGFLGIALVVEPRAFGVSIGDLSGMLSGLFGGFATLAIWSLSSSESAARQMFYFSSLTLLFSMAPLPWVWEMPSRSDVPALLALGVLTMFAQHFLALGCTTAATDKVVAWGYTSVIFSAFFGYAIWDEAVGVTSAVGMAFVVAGAYWTVRTKRMDFDS